MKSKNLWEDPRILEQGRQTMHVPLGAWLDEASARSANRFDSANRLSLNGSWAFKLFDCPESVPENFYAKDFDLSLWSSMPVPSNWQLQESSLDKPIYSNIALPFEPNPPYVPPKNPCGCYVRSFEIPADWQSKRVFVSFESVDSSFFVYINGQELGYGQDSRLPSEFELTDFLKPGSNTLAVKVLRYSCGTYLEDQDYWQMSGIQREVFLLAKPLVHIRDFSVRTIFDELYQHAELQVDVFLSELLHHKTTDSDFEPKGRVFDAYKAEYQAYLAQIRLYDQTGKPVFDQVIEQDFSAHTLMYPDTSYTPLKGGARFKVKIDSPEPWSAESPTLYTLTIELMKRSDSKGTKLQVVDVEATKFGFRQFEIRNRQLCINGRRMVIRGVNRHEHHYRSGRALSAKQMRADIVAMKQLNFNAVRTSHYPNDSVWYDLCDELGLYVVDEANIETHGTGGDLTRDPNWLAFFMIRAQRMVMRDKNHACVAVWSLGNESQWGPHHAAMRSWIKEYEPTRPVQYESGNPPASVTDIMCPMYPTLDWVEDVMHDKKETRPMILCEYAYAKGNASGNFYKFWDMVYRYEGFQGGFIWEWHDAALIRKLPDGTEGFAYGGDLGETYPYAVVGEEPSQVLNGIVSPDLIPHPGAWEIKNIQAPIKFIGAESLLLVDGGLTVKVHNRQFFKTCQGLGLNWSVHCNGVMLTSGAQLMPAIEAGAQDKIVIDLKKAPENWPEHTKHHEYFLDLSIVQLTATSWAPAGHELVRHQYAVTKPAVQASSQPAQQVQKSNKASNGAIQIKQTQDRLSFTFSNGNSIGFASKSAQICSMAYADGHEVLSSTLMPNLYRAPTENDWVIGMEPSYSKTWKKLGLDQLHFETSDFVFAPDRENPSTILLSSTQTAHGQAGFLAEWKTNTTIKNDGTIACEHLVCIQADCVTLPRVGVRLQLHKSFDAIRWFGRGPWENYPDRKSASLLGQYELSVDKELSPYIFPGEYGARQDVRWLTCRDPKGRGLAIEASPQLSFSALPFSQESLAEGRHSDQLVKNGHVNLNIDAAILGVGGDNGWYQNVYPEYLIAPATYRFGYVMRLIMED